MLALRLRSNWQSSRRFLLIIKKNLARNQNADHSMNYLSVDSKSIKKSLNQRRIQGGLWG